MNDFILLAILWIVISEIIYILFRIDYSCDEWYEDKFAAFGLGFILTFFQLIIIIPWQSSGFAALVWTRLYYEVIFIGGIGLLFYANYLLSKLIDYIKFYEKPKRKKI